MSSNKRKPSATLTKIMSSITDEDKRRTRDRMLIAVKIADALEAKKLSQKAFAELMRKSESEISEWLHIPEHVRSARDIEIVQF